MTEVQTSTGSSEPPIIVYWLSDSRADRILFILEELALPYKIEIIERGPNRLASPELKKIHPLGKSPVIKDGERVVAESGFIIEYLIEKYGKGKNLKPTDEEALFHYNYVCICTNDNRQSTRKTQSPWIIKHIIGGIFNKVDEIFLGPTLTSHIDFLEAELDKRQWLADSDFSGADVHAGLQSKWQ
ncbi:unnamed protein product [Rotaria magnacalcarata]|uniref:glutathione transferase n=1 Tax=Rotaria magnacalcarata TaxID=392030 RepID=A0A816M333_9BILA|nr:unnamed protein product [Rotaria magnacalcarata]